MLDESKWDEQETRHQFVPKRSRSKRTAPIIKCNSFETENRYSVNLKTTNAINTLTKGIFQNTAQHFFMRLKLLSLFIVYLIKNILRWLKRVNIYLIEIAIFLRERKTRRFTQQSRKCLESLDYKTWVYLAVIKDINHQSVALAST